MPSSDFFNFIDINSESLLVWFGGRNEPFISIKMANATGCDVLTIKNMRGDWYVGGIGDVEGGLTGGENWLGEQLKRKPYTKIYFAGQSSGGYMCLKMAHKFSPNLVIAFNPTTQNWPAGSRVFSPKFPLTNLSDLYEKHPVTFPVSLNVGRSENDHAKQYVCNDLKHSERLSVLDNVHYMKHPIDCHPMTAELAKRGQFYKFVAGMISIYG